MVFKYITPPYSKGWVYWYANISICHVSTFPSFHVPNSRHVSPMWLGYPSSHGSTGPISPASCALMLSWSNSLLITCTILFIRSVTTRQSRAHTQNITSHLLYLFPPQPNCWGPPCCPTGSICVNISTYDKPSAFEQNTGYTTRGHGHGHGRRCRHGRRREYRHAHRGSL